ncbi:MAG: anaerobic ribonucleoside-triphosphate reductase [Bacilli bacterium]|nr:anaerobic ribonucleoside-triphosphate reductase [Bacilli bacterium]
MKKDVFEDLVVVKRSGQRVSFNSYKIAVAIKQAFDNVYGLYDEANVNEVFAEVLLYIKKNYIDRKTINVEDIQDIIENTLRQEKHFKVYEAFSQYRQKRAACRKVFTIKQQHKFIKAIEKIDENNSLRVSNNYKPTELLIKYGTTVASEFSKSYIIDSKYLRAHEEGNIYIHQLETLPLGILANVHLNLKEENIVSIPKLIDILNIKSEIKGYINIPQLDYILEDWFLNQYRKYLIEYLINYFKISGFKEYLNLKKIIELINKEDKLEFDIEKYQQFILSKPVENLFKIAVTDAFNKTKEKLANTLLNIFTIFNTNKIYSVSLGTNDSVVGCLINLTVLDLIKENDFNNLNIIFKLKNNESKYLEKISENLLLGKNIFLTFIESSFNKDNEEVEYFPDGTRIFENINSASRASIGRMIVSKTSINMGRLGIKYQNKSIKEFYLELEETLELAKNNLLLSFEIIGDKNKENYQYLFTGNILDDEKLEVGQKIRKVIKDGSLLIGLVGLKECVFSLEKNEDKQFKLIIDILKFLNKKCSEFENDTKINFKIYEPSSEEVRRELMALDKAIYGIKKGATEDEKYSLVATLFKDDYKKQGIVQKLFNGGNLLEIKIPAKTSSKKVTELIKNLQKSDIGNVKISIRSRDT